MRRGSALTRVPAHEEAGIGQRSEKWDWDSAYLGCRRKRIDDAGGIADRNSLEVAVSCEVIAGRTRAETFHVRARAKSRACLIPVSGDFEDADQAARPEVVGAVRKRRVRPRLRCCKGKADDDQRRQWLQELPSDSSAPRLVGCRRQIALITLARQASMGQMLLG